VEAHDRADVLRGTPTRFVPLATEAGSPRKMSSGSVRNDPPPASTLMTAATKPMTNSAA
jgi:hypothetical protein